MKLCVGLTGGIGSGKSTVAKLFAAHGAGIVDTDAIAHQLTQSDGNAIPTLRRIFGNEYINQSGALDRNKMRLMIFANATEKQRLENVLHPLILEQTQQQIQQLQHLPYIMLVVPLLPTSPAFQKLIQRTLVVDCTEETQLARISQRDQMDTATARQIITQQTSRNERLKLADDIIDNNSTPNHLVAQVLTLHKIYKTLPNTN